MKTRNKISNDNVEVLLISLLAINLFYPPLRAHNLLILTLILFLIWAVIAYIKNDRYFKNLTYYRLMLTLYLILTLTIPTIVGNHMIRNRTLGTIAFYLMYIVYDYYNQNNRKNVIKKSIKIVSVFIFITVSKTAMALINNPYISRQIKSSGELTNNILSQGIGGYEFIYFLLILLPFLFYLIFYSEENITKKNKIGLIIIFFIISYLIVLSNYFTAFVIMVGSIFLLITLKKILSDKYLLLVFILLIFISLLFYKNLLIYFLKLLIDFSGDSLTNIRLDSLLNNLISTNSIKLDTKRFDLLSTSLGTFINNPLFGLVTRKKIDLYVLYSSISAHSYILDTFALYGGIIGIMQLYLLIYPFYNRLNFKNKYLSLTMIVFIIILLINNTMTGSMGISLWFIGLYIIDNY